MSTTINPEGTVDKKLSYGLGTGHDLCISL